MKYLIYLFSLSGLLASNHIEKAKQQVIKARQDDRLQKFAQEVGRKQYKRIHSKEFMNEFSDKVQSNMVANGQVIRRCPVKPRKNIIESEVRYPRVIAFVSFSMSDVALKNLFTELQRVGGQLMFRGFVNNSIKETANKYKQVGIIGMIDPTMFRAYKITQAPTIVLLKESPVTQGKLVIHDRISGNIRVEYALEQFANNGEVPDAKEILAKYRGKNK